MFNDLRPDQRIIFYSFGELVYAGKFENVPNELMNELSMADFYLLDALEDYDVIAVY